MGNVTAQRFTSVRMMLGASISIHSISNILHPDAARQPHEFASQSRRVRESRVSQQSMIEGTGDQARALAPAI